MYVYVHMCVHAYVYVHVYVCKSMYMYGHVGMRMYVQYVQVSVCMHNYAYLRMCMFMHVYALFCTCVHTCLHVYVHAYSTHELLTNPLDGRFLQPFLCCQPAEGMAAATWQIVSCKPHDAIPGGSSSTSTAQQQVPT